MSVPASVVLPTPRRHNSASVIQQTSLWGPVVYTSNDRDMLHYSTARSSQVRPPSLNDRSSDQVSSQRVASTTTTTRSSKAIGPLPYYAVPRAQNTKSTPHRSHHHHNSNNNNGSMARSNGTTNHRMPHAGNGTSVQSGRPPYTTHILPHDTDPLRPRRNSMLSLSLTPTTLSSAGSANANEGVSSHHRGTNTASQRPNGRASPAAAVPLRTSSITNNHSNNNNNNNTTVNSTSQASRGQAITVLSVYSPVASDDPRLQPHYQKQSPQSRPSPPPQQIQVTQQPSPSLSSASRPRLPAAVRETLPSIRPPLATTTRPRHASAPSARPGNAPATIINSANGERASQPQIRQASKSTQTEDRSYIAGLPSQPRASQPMENANNANDVSPYVSHTPSVMSSTAPDRGVDVALQAGGGHPPMAQPLPPPRYNADNSQPLVPYNADAAALQIPTRKQEQQQEERRQQPSALARQVVPGLPPRPAPAGTRVRIHTNTLTTTQHKVRYIGLEDEFDPDAPDPSDMGVAEAARYAQRFQQQQHNNENTAGEGEEEEEDALVPRGAYMSDGRAWVRRSNRGPVASTRHPLRITEEGENGEAHYDAYDNEGRAVQPSAGPVYVMVPQGMSDNSNDDHRDVHRSEDRMAEIDSRMGPAGGTSSSRAAGAVSPYGVYTNANNGGGMGAYLLQRHVQQAVTGPLAAGTSFAPPPQPPHASSQQQQQQQQQQQYARLHMQPPRQQGEQHHEEGDQAAYTHHAVPFPIAALPSQTAATTATTTATKTNGQVNEAVGAYVAHPAMSPASAPPRHRFANYNHYTFSNEAAQPMQYTQGQAQQGQYEGNSIRAPPRVVVSAPYRGGGGQQKLPRQSPYTTQAHADAYPYEEDEAGEVERPHDAYAAHRHGNARSPHTNNNNYEDEDEDDDDEEEEELSSSRHTPERWSRQPTGSEPAYKPLSEQRTESAQAVRTSGHHQKRRNYNAAEHAVHERLSPVHHIVTPGERGSVRHATRPVHTREERHTGGSSEHGGTNNNNYGRSSSCDTNTQPAMLSERDSKDVASDGDEDAELAKPRPQHLIIDEEVYTLPIDQSHPEVALRLSRSDFDQGQAMYTSVNHNTSNVLQESARRMDSGGEGDGHDEDEEDVSVDEVVAEEESVNEYAHSASAA